MSVKNEEPRATAAESVPSATKGPWRVVECSGLHEYMVVSDEWSVAEMCGERATAEANARLIAAAPTLLNSLKEVVASIHDAGFAMNECVKSTAHLLRIADAWSDAMHAIKIAEGRQ